MITLLDLSPPRTNDPFPVYRYKPVTFEFARCNVQQNVLSKRRLMDLVTKSLVQGWDDPRLLTLRGLRCECHKVESRRDAMDHVHSP